MNGCASHILRVRGTLATPDGGKYSILFEAARSRTKSSGTIVLLRHVNCAAWGHSGWRPDESGESREARGSCWYSFQQAQCCHRDEKEQGASTTMAF